MYRSNFEGGPSPIPTNSVQHLLEGLVPGDECEHRAAVNHVGKVMWLQRAESRALTHGVAHLSTPVWQVPHPRVALCHPVGAANPYQHLQRTPCEARKPNDSADVQHQLYRLGQPQPGHLPGTRNGHVGPNR